jgi:hypothetical protein
VVIELCEDMTALSVVIAMMVQNKIGEDSYKPEMDMLGFNIGR